ncbi:MAG TPA: HD domain-containing phosphohydrolase [Gaiellaceae bacterium]|nr:HD domain-containing phosphohydrolase [Gaiellaceae bacterium]
MRIVSTSRIPDDAVLARDIRTGHFGAAPLLRRGTRMNERYSTALQRAGIGSVYIDDLLGDGISLTPAISEETRNEATDVLEQAMKAVRREPDGRSSVPDAVLKPVIDLVDTLVEEIETCDGSIVSLQDLAAPDAYPIQHPIDVTVLGLLLGRQLLLHHGWVDHLGTRRYDRIDERLVQLGQGLLVHDFGQLTVPKEVFEKPDQLDPEEWEMVKGHPEAGIQLCGSRLTAVACTVIRLHHERWDGSGYPKGLAGRAIHPFGRVAAVADVYDAVTSARRYAPARPPHVGWQIIVGGAGTSFDETIVELFRKVVPPHPPGSEVTVADGRRGVVASVTADRPELPVVRIGWDEGGSRVTPYEVKIPAKDLTPADVAAAVVA